MALRGPGGVGAGVAMAVVRRGRPGGVLAQARGMPANISAFCTLSTILFCCFLTAAIAARAEAAASRAAAFALSFTPFLCLRPMLLLRRDGFLALRMYLLRQFWSVRAENWTKTRARTQRMLWCSSICTKSMPHGGDRASSRAQSLRLDLCNHTVGVLE